MAGAIASGLAELHAANLIHGNLKPENVFVMEDGRLKIGLFVFYLALVYQHFDDLFCTFSSGYGPSTTC
jgi:serine/threonine protein kinase